MTGIEAIEATAFRPIEINLTEKLALLNNCFHSKLTPENGIYGITETLKDNGILERLGINEFGHKVKEYFIDGRLIKRRELLGNHCNATTLFDDNGTAYLRTVTKLGNNHITTISSTLTPDVTITKGNFTSIIDAYGRPVINKITDLSVRPIGEAKKALTIKPDSSYRPGDHRGHLIADCFGGPATKENIVAQLGEVNQGKMAQVESIVRNLKSEGHTVDYAVKANYIGTQDARPTSFEPRITVDGKEYTDLPKDLQKIYNDSSSTGIAHISTDIGEKFGVANEVGINAGLFAAGTTFIVSTADNLTAYIDGKITPEQMIGNIIEDTALSGTLGYGTAFLSSAISQAMQTSNAQLIRSIGGSCLPAAVVTFVVESISDISAFAQSEIDSSEFAYNLGENAASIAGGMQGAALGGEIGTGIGSIAGPAGAVVGGVAGSLIGGLAGCILATEAYETAIQLGADGAQYLAEIATEYAASTIGAISETIPGSLNDAKEALNDYFSKTSISFCL